MNAAAIIGLVALCLTQLGALLATVWKIATIVAEIGQIKKATEEKQKQVDAELDALKQIPTIVVRLSMVESVAALVPKHDGAIQVLQSQVGSMREMRRVAPSTPNIGGE